MVGSLIPRSIWGSREGWGFPSWGFRAAQSHDLEPHLSSAWAFMGQRAGKPGLRFAPGRLRVRVGVGWGTGGDCRDPGGAGAGQAGRGEPV